MRNHLYHSKALEKRYRRLLSERISWFLNLNQEQFHLHYMYALVSRVLSIKIDIYRLFYANIVINKHIILPTIISAVFQDVKKKKSIKTKAWELLTIYFIIVITFYVDDIVFVWYWWVLKMRKTNISQSHYHIYHSLSFSKEKDF